MKVMGTMKHKQIITLIGEVLTIEMLPSNGSGWVGGTRFFIICYKGWLGGQNGGILVLGNY